MPSRLPELTALLRIRDDENLRAFLAEHAGTLGGELGVARDDVEQLLALDDASLRVQLDRLVRQHRELTSAHRDARLRAESAQAVAHLVETARFRERGAQLDPALLLGPMLAEHVLYAMFHVDGIGVAVERSRLLLARRVLQPFPDVTAHVGLDALRLGWHGGRGGLVFVHQLVAPADRDRVLHVVLDRPTAVAITTFPSLPVPPPDARSFPGPRPRPGAWLADVLAAFGSQL